MIPIHYNSIYHRLLGFLALFLILCVCTAGLIALKSARVEIKEDYDAQMAANSSLIYMLVHEELEEKNNLNEIQQSFPQNLTKLQIHSNSDEYDRWHGFRLWKGKHILLKSFNAPGIDVQKVAIGYQNVIWNNHHWRVYSHLYPDQAVYVEMWEDVASREELYSEIWQGFLKSLIVMLPISFLLLYGTIHYALSRMNDVLMQVEHYNPDILEPIQVNNLPRELTPVVGTMNNLISKVQKSMERERMFINNAAHEIRTPLTALNLQAQLLKKESPHSEIALSIINAVTKTSHLVNQLLTLARVGHYNKQQSIISLSNFLHDIISERSPIIASKNLTLNLLIPQSAIIRSVQEPLRIMLCTILDNAIKYAHNAGTIDIAYDKGILSISDDGPGIPVSERDKVFEKFYRAKNVTIKEGSGLGLAIAKEIAQLLNIGLSITSPPNGIGTMVHIAFPDDIR